MEKESKKSIRNGLIVGTILLLIPILTDIGKNFISWLWTRLVIIWDSLFETYPIPGWLALALLILALIGLASFWVAFFSASVKRVVAAYHDYVEDVIGLVIWRWNWSGNTIINLSAFCPQCDAHLVYQEPSYSSYEHHVNLICENCSSTKESLDGDSYRYVLDKTKREISRRIRTGEYNKRNTSEHKN